MTQYATYSNTAYDSSMRHFAAAAAACLTHEKNIHLKDDACLPHVCISRELQPNVQVLSAGSLQQCLAQQLYNNSRLQQLFFMCGHN